MKRVYLARHGQTVGNVDRFFQFPETELTEKGHDGGKALAERFRDIEIDHLLASHFRRAEQTAAYISELHSIEVETLEELHESYRPLSVRGLEHTSTEGEKHKTEYKENFWNAEYLEEGAENYLDVIKRIQTSLEYLKQCTGESIVVVSHGDYIRLLTAYILIGEKEDSESLKTVFYKLSRMSNVGITELLFDEDGWKLDKWNDNVHFAE